MKVGTIHSPFPYDAAARHALQSPKLRHPTTLHYAWRALPSIFGGWFAYPSIAALSINPETDVMGMEQTGLMLAGHLTEKMPQATRSLGKS
jgi:hypothetical protein